MMKKPKGKKTRKQLEAEIVALKAQLTSSYWMASERLKELGKDKMMGSAVILTMTHLDGREAIGPVAIRDGLSDETIKAIKEDLIRSFDLATELQP